MYYSFLKKGDNYMKCPNCGKEIAPKVAERYQYLESGLDNIVLKGIKVFECPCGESIASIPSIDELHSLIGRIIVKKESLLNGKEIRFLRKNNGFSGKKLASQMGIANATLSRWETGAQPISKPHDLLLRLIYCAIKGIPVEETANLIQEEFSAIEESHKDIPPYIIPQDEWSHSHSCSSN